MAFHHLSWFYIFGMTGWLLLLAAFVCFVLKRLGNRIEKQKSSTKLKMAISTWLLLCLLTLLELFFATIYDQSDGFNMTNVSKKWFVLHVEPDQKALMFHDGEGTIYRDIREFPKKPGDKHHICFLGDSFTYGHGIPELGNRFSNLVGDNLENKFSGKYVVSNLADAGRDLLWVKAVLMECFESNYRIDTVVYVMCLNDIEMFHRDRNKFYQDIAKFQPKFFLFRDTYFFNLFYIRMRLFSQPEVSGYYSMLVDYYKGQPWQAMSRKLKEVQTLCDRNNAKLKVVVFPFVQQFPTEYPFAQAHRKAVRFCEDRKIPVLDLGPVLLPHVKDGLTVNRFDPHPNEEAHRMAADAISQWLRPLPRMKN